MQLIERKLILYSSGVLGLSLVVGFIAMMALVVGEQVVMEFFLGIPYPFLFFGLGSSLGLMIFLYFYLKKGVN